MVMSERHLDFHNLHSVAVSDDGAHVTLKVAESIDNFNLHIPMETLPSFVRALLEASAQGMRVMDEQSLQVSEIRRLHIFRNPDDSEKAVIGVTLHTGSAPLCFGLPRKDLVAFARDVLEGEGLLTPPKPASAPH